MAMIVPSKLEDLTPAWLTEVLQAGGVISHSRVTRVEPKVLGQDIGFLSIVLKLSIDYDQPEVGAPNAVVLKVETNNEQLREFGQEVQAFQREIQFYKEVAHQVNVRLPKVYYAVNDDPNFMIVMEDLSYCRPGDQVKGMPVDLVMATAALMGRLQAKYWNNDALDALDWMPLSNRMEREYDENWPSFEQHFSDWIDEAGVELGRRMGRHIDWIFNEIACRPKTITHNDLREDNLLFDESGAVTEVIILDWQLATRSMGVFDVARLMAGSALPEQRRGAEIEILRAWYAALVAEGVDDYYWEEALYDLRLALLEFLCFIIHMHKAFIGGTGRGALLTEVIVKRAFASAVDLNAGVAMPS